MAGKILDIFGDDAFSVVSMAEGMREIGFVPGLISSLGIFNVESIDTTQVAIEKETDGAMVLVPSSPRGGPGQTIGGTKRQARILRVPHFQRDDAMYAEEVQNVRRFNSDKAVETLQAKIAKKAARHSQHFALTEEYHRLNVIKGGNLLDADGSTLVSFGSEFGETLPAEIDFDLDNATPAKGALRRKCAELERMVADTLGGLPYTRLLAVMGKKFADDFYAHGEVRETYLGTEQASKLREGYVTPKGDAFSAYDFGGIDWKEYRGGGSIKVDDDKVHFIPLGVPDLFQTFYSPADYIETVNTMGQRLYAKQYPMPNDKGVNLEFQMNGIQLCTRPRCLFSGRRT